MRNGSSRRCINKSRRPNLRRRQMEDRRRSAPRMCGCGSCLARKASTPPLAALVSLDYLSIAIDTAPDRRVAAVAVGTTLLAAVVAAVLPSIRLSGVGLQGSMAGEGRTATSAGSQRLMRTLVAAQ